MYDDRVFLLLDDAHRLQGVTFTPFQVADWLEKDTGNIVETKCVCGTKTEGLDSLFMVEFYDDSSNKFEQSFFTTVGAAANHMEFDLSPRDYISQVSIHTKTLV